MPNYRGPKHVPEHRPFERKYQYAGLIAALQDVIDQEIRARAATSYPTQIDLEAAYANLDGQLEAVLNDTGNTS